MSNNVIRTNTALFVEVFELGGSEGPESVTRRENVSGMTRDNIDAYARGFAARIDNELFGVRLAEVTVNTLATY